MNIPGALLVAAVMMVLDGAPALAADDGPSLLLGRLTNGSHGTKQAFTFKNANVALDWVHVECGFFNNDQLIGAEFTSLHNVAAGQTAYGEVLIHDDATRADCRIGDSHKAAR